MESKSIHPGSRHPGSLCRGSAGLCRPGMARNCQCSASRDPREPFQQVAGLRVVLGPLKPGREGTRLRQPQLAAAVKETSRCQLRVDGRAVLGRTGV